MEVPVNEAGGTVPKSLMDVVHDESGTSATTESNSISIQMLDIQAFPPSPTTPPLQLVVASFT